jgi:hypothetical protein
MWYLGVVILRRKIKADFVSYLPDFAVVVQLQSNFVKHAVYVPGRISGMRLHATHCIKSAAHVSFREGIVKEFPSKKSKQEFVHKNHYSLY